MTIEEKIEIVEDVSVKKHYHENVCSKFGIGRESIKHLLRNIKKDPQYLSKLNQKRISKLNREHSILESIERVQVQDQTLKSAKVICEDIEENQGSKVSGKMVRKVLNSSGKLKFKKQKKIPLHANSLRNQYMRQQFSMKMLQFLVDGKRILAVDETWFGETNYSRQSWQQLHQQESQRNNVFRPRITMMAAVDNYGDAYLSLLQANTNQYTFAEFVRELVRILDKDRPQWRSDTIWLVDGAKMHTTQLVQDIYTKLKIPIMVAPPYSWNLVATEKWHSMFKSGELNATGKSMTKSKCIIHYLHHQNSLAMSYRWPSIRPEPSEEPRSS